MKPQKAKPLQPRPLSPKATGKNAAAAATAFSLSKGEGEGLYHRSILETGIANGAGGVRNLADTFADTSLWIFDLDNTLYPAECNLFAQIDARMSAFIQDLLGVDPVEARRIQKQLYYEHGTTLAGLMAEHGVKPEAFMDYVHDIDLSPIQPAPELADAIVRLQGRKFIFTNGSARHAERIAEKLGVLDKFDGIFDIATGGYVPKPKPQAFRRFMDFCSGGNCGSAMFEDLPHNLEAAHALGIVTVLVRSDYLDHPSQHALKAAGRLPDYIHFETDDLAAFLRQVTASQAKEKAAPTAPPEHPSS